MLIRRLTTELFAVTNMPPLRFVIFRANVTCERVAVDLYFSVPLNSKLPPLESAELPLKMLWLTLRTPWLNIAPPASIAPAIGSVTSFALPSSSIKRSIVSFPLASTQKMRYSSSPLMVKPLPLSVISDVTRGSSATSVISAESEITSTPSPAGQPPVTVSVFAALIASASLQFSSTVISAALMGTAIGAASNIVVWILPNNFRR